MQQPTAIGQSRADRGDTGRTVRIEQDDWDKLKVLAEASGVTRHKFIVTTIKRAIVEAVEPEASRVAVFGE